MHNKVDLSLSLHGASEVILAQVPQVVKLPVTRLEKKKKKRRGIFLRKLNFLKRLNSQNKHIDNLLF